MWEQLNLARTLNTKNIWIMNVGDLKMLEVPLEWFMNLGYDFEKYSANSLQDHLIHWAEREFGLGSKPASEVAEMMQKYSVSLPPLVSLVFMVFG